MTEKTLLITANEQSLDRILEGKPFSIPDLLKDFKSAVIVENIGPTTTVITIPEQDIPALEEAMREFCTIGEDATLIFGVDESTRMALKL